MINPSVLRAAFVTALQGVSPLVALLGGEAANIEEYTDEVRGDLATRITQLDPPKLLVCCSGIGLTGRQTTMFAPRFELVLRPTSDPFEIFAVIVDNLLNRSIHPSYHQMDPPPQMERRFIAISDTSQIDYWAILTGFSGKGLN